MKKIVLLFTFICTLLSAQSQYNKGVKLEPILKTDTTSIGQKIVYPQVENAEVSIMKVTIPSGQSTGWHKHSFPVFAYVLQGTLTVKIEGGKTLHFPIGSSFSEVINTNHNGENNQKEDVVLIAFFVGEKGKPLSTH